MVATIARPQNLLFGFWLVLFTAGVVAFLLIASSPVTTWLTGIGALIGIYGGFLFAGYDAAHSPKKDITWKTLVVMMTGYTLGIIAFNSVIPEPFTLTSFLF